MGEINKIYKKYKISIDIQWIIQYLLLYTRRVLDREQSEVTYKKSIEIWRNF